MANYLGITGIRLYVTQFIDMANEFLSQHDGSIIDIHVSTEDIVIVYKEDANEQPNENEQ